MQRRDRLRCPAPGRPPGSAGAVLRRVDLKVIFRAAGVGGEVRSRSVSDVVCTSTAVEAGSVVLVVGGGVVVVVGAACWYVVLVVVLVVVGPCVVVLVVLVVVECVVVVGTVVVVRASCWSSTSSCWSSSRWSRWSSCVDGLVVVVVPPHEPVSVGGKLGGSAGSVPQSSSRRSKTPSRSRSTPMRVAGARAARR